MQRILLVEDNEMNRDLISRRLKRRGFEVLLAVDGAEGVEKANAEKPDLILMDMGLPILDGYEATRLLKDSQATRAIPILGLSAHAMSGDSRRALDAGCDDYDTKPVDWPRLLTKIHALLEAALDSRTAASTPTQSDPTADAAAAPGAAHVLVVDDNALHRQMLAAHLGTLGHTFDLAADGTEALTHLERRSFDLVLLDVTLPEVAGRSVLQRIRADRRWQDLPILMLSTIDAIGQAIECLDEGAEDLISQPFHLKVVKARLAACLERHRLKEQLRDRQPSAPRSAPSVELLLQNIFPGEILEELRTTRKILPRRYSEVALLFCDVVNFRQMSDRHDDPVEILNRLHRVTLLFEGIAERHGLEKVRTVGDSFMAAAGLFGAIVNPALAAARCAFEMHQMLRDHEVHWSLRSGIHSGPVVAGVIGRSRLQFDLWGDTVQTAAKVKRASPAGMVSVSDAAWRQIASHSSGRSLGSIKLRDGSLITVHGLDQIRSGPGLA